MAHIIEHILSIFAAILSILDGISKNSSHLEPLSMSLNLTSKWKLPKFSQFTWWKTASKKNLKWK